MKREKNTIFGGMLHLTAAVLLCLSAATVAVAAAGPVVREVLISKDGNGARIDIRADQPLRYQSYLMVGLEKWVIDLANATTTFAGDESKKMRTFPLERVTVRQRDVNGDPITRIGLDFKGEVDFLLKEDPLDKGHLIVFMKPAKPVLQKPAGETPPPAVYNARPPQ